MKKLLIIVTLGCLVGACSQKAVSSTHHKEWSKQNSEPDPLLKGWYVYQMKCGQCHELKSVEHYTSQRWTEILQQMIPKAKLNSDEKQQLIEFIQAKAKG